MLDKEKQNKIDKLHQHILDGALLNELTNMEVASLLTSVMRNILIMKRNSQLLNNMGVDITKLTPEVVTLIQKIWTEEYIKENE
ncbi:hypothetical protein [Miniphocaeibacter massiliensis]|uniref:hypothetical protein n=1 Tax=Miniphocaeibacter massiliensis TaxID=2041841 RepID=UPI000C1C642C|nr:hypothetical protein [Miniphocaeibacter massiliensis]